MPVIEIILVVTISLSKANEEDNSANNKVDINVKDIDVTIEVL